MGVDAPVARGVDGTLYDWSGNIWVPPEQRFNWNIEKQLAIAWAAGFFDGEGTIYLAKIEGHRGRKTIYELRIGVSQVDPEPVIKLTTMFGGYHGKQKTMGGTKRNQHRWTVSSAKAERFLREVLPYLTTKRSQAEMALEFRNSIKWGNRSLTEEQLAWRETIRVKLSEEKKKVFD